MWEMPEMKTRVIAASIAALGLAASAAQASEPTGTEAAPAGSDSQALRVVRDKQTGKLRAPTADELKAMQAAERAERRARGLPESPQSQPLVVTRHADGMLSAKLGPEYMMTLKGERQPDGSMRRFHEDGTTHEPAPAAHNDLPTE
jgi:hypothetical protein